MEELNKQTEKAFDITTPFVPHAVDVKKGLQSFDAEGNIVDSDRFYELESFYNVRRDKEIFDYKLKKANEFFETEENFIRLEQANIAKDHLTKNGVDEDTAKILGHNSTIISDFKSPIAETIAVEDFNIALKKGDLVGLGLTGTGLLMYLLGTPVGKTIGSNLIGGSWNQLTKLANKFRYRNDVPIEETRTKVFGKEVDLDDSKVEDIFEPFNAKDAADRNLDERNSFLREDLYKRGIQSFSPTVRKGIQGFPNYDSLSSQKVILPSELLSHLENLPTNNKAILNSVNIEKIFKFDSFFYLWNKDIFNTVQGDKIADNPAFGKVGNTSTLEAVDAKLKNFEESILNARPDADGGFTFEYNNKLTKIDERSIPSYLSDKKYNNLTIPQKYIKAFNDRYFNFINKKLQTFDKGSLGVNFEVDVYGGKFFGQGDSVVNRDVSAKLDYSTSDELKKIDDREFTLSPGPSTLAFDKSQVPYSGYQSQSNAGLMIPNKVNQSNGTVVVRSPFDINSNVMNEDGRNTSIYTSGSRIRDSFIRVKKSLEDNKSIFDSRPPTPREVIFGSSQFLKNIDILKDDIDTAFIMNQLKELLKTKSFPVSTPSNLTDSDIRNFLTELMTSKKRPDDFKNTKNLVQSALVNFPAADTYDIVLPISPQVAKNIQINAAGGNIPFMKYTMTRDEVSKVFFDEYKTIATKFPNMGVNINNTDDMQKFYQLNGDIRKNLIAMAMGTNKRGYNTTHGYGADSIIHTRFTRLDNGKVIIDEIQSDLHKVKYSQYFNEYLKKSTKKSRREHIREAEEYARNKIIKDDTLPFDNVDELVEQVLKPLILDTKKNNGQFIIMPNLEKLANIRTGGNRPMTTKKLGAKGGVDLDTIRKSVVNTSKKISLENLFNDPRITGLLYNIRTSSNYKTIKQKGILSIPAKDLDVADYEETMQLIYTKMPDDMQYIYTESFDKASENLVLKTKGKIRAVETTAKYKHIPSDYMNVNELDDMERTYRIHEKIQTWKGITNALDGRTPDKVKLNEFADYNAIKNYPEDPVVRKKFASMVKSKLGFNDTSLTGMDYNESVQNLELFLDKVGIDKKSLDYTTYPQINEIVNKIPDEKFVEFYEKTKQELIDFNEVFINGIEEELSTKTLDLRDILNDVKDLDNVRVGMAKGGLVNA
tara:strand:+ start:4834 stop:8313 length:3480 start_codon:yes stop_codon:yes gene_type:complete